MEIGLLEVERNKIEKLIDDAKDTTSIQILKEKFYSISEDIQKLHRDLSEAKINEGRIQTDS